jgi:hypothetical protein
VGATRSGTTWTLTRDIFCTNITVDSGVTVVAKYRMFATGTLDNNGTIHNDGNSSASNLAANGASAGSLGHGVNAAAGVSSGTTTVAGGTAAGTSGTNYVLGGVGGAGGNANGGAGGGPATVVTGTAWYRDLVHAISQVFARPSTSTANTTVVPTNVGVIGGLGGGGGGRTTGGTATESGGGGGGAGVMVIVARILDNAGGIIRAKGGNGANATGGTCSAGGGGGGGGGVIFLIYDTFTSGTQDVTGGSAGTGLNGAAAAVAGSSGQVIQIPNA